MIALRYACWFAVAVLLLQPDIARSEELHARFRYSEDATTKNDLLLAKGADDPLEGPLSRAVSMGYADVIVLMLRDAAVVRNEGPYALNLSVQQGRLEITQLLLASGISPNEPIKGGWYPYAEAAKQGDVSSMCLMLDYGVNVSLKNDRVGNLVMALSGRHFDAAVLLMLSGYVPDDSEKKKVLGLGDRWGARELYSAVMSIKPNEGSLSQQCKAAEKSWKSVMAK